MLKKTILSRPLAPNGNFIKQPNRITKARLPRYSLLMQKIFTAISKELSKYVEQSYNDTPMSEMIFSESNGEKILLEIPYKSIINDATHFEEVDKTLEQMAGITIKIPYKDIDGENWKYITAPFSTSLPDRRNKKFKIHIEVKTVRLFIELDKGKNGEKMYTKFLPQISFNANCKHTSPIYNRLASWRKKGYFKIKLTDLYKDLVIEEFQYKRYCDFKKKVLLRVQNDLIRCKSDIWYDCNRKDFKYIENGEIWLRFTVISEEILEKDKIKVNQIMNALRVFKLTENQLVSLHHIIYNVDIQKSDIVNEISRISEYIHHYKYEITDQTKYMVSSLMKSFKNFNTS